ncbi:MAG: hypothetical protein PHH26_01595 [Candidatus Thermoplasmatota archaeon]|nr:hypothetical protein [Candidatus Thermoplasmatota archaeon]
MKHAAQTSEKCSVAGCKNEAEHSVPSEKATGALKDVKIEGDGRKVSLCREHYKSYKKATKTDRTVERAYW